MLCAFLAFPQSKMLIALVLFAQGTREFGRSESGELIRVIVNDLLATVDWTSSTPTPTIVRVCNVCTEPTDDQIASSGHAVSCACER